MANTSVYLTATVLGIIVLVGAVGFGLSDSSGLATIKVEKSAIGTSVCGAGGTWCPLNYECKQRPYYRSYCAPASQPIKTYGELGQKCGAGGTFCQQGYECIDSLTAGAYCKPVGSKTTGLR
ncbi:MAG: hypothetical protein HYT16_00940 [DPANN group archaeon]|nr:hypothetical protein [DPANN group archaeon]